MRREEKRGVSQGMPQAGCRLGPADWVCHLSLRSEWKIPGTKYRSREVCVPSPAPWKHRKLQKPEEYIPGPRVSSLGDKVLGRTPDQEAPQESGRSLPRPYLEVCMQIKVLQSGFT